MDALDVAHRAGMGGRINTVMQTCFFALANIFPREEAIGYIKRQIKKTYGAKGEDVVKKNYAVVDDSLAHLHEVAVPKAATSKIELPPIVSDRAPDFVKRVTAVILAGKGDALPVSAFPIDGTWPTATAKWEKRNLALEIPVWDPVICIQCNKCAMVCPHAAIRAKIVPAAALAGAPATFKSTPFKATYCQGDSYVLQVAPEDCTGCMLCVEVCPAKDKKNPRHKAIDMVAQAPLRAAEHDNYEFFLALPEVDRSKVPLDVKGTQFFEPLFEYLGRLLRLRRDALCQADDPALRRPCADRERHRLLLDLRRQPADDALRGEPGGPRAGLEQFAVRGQRRIRLRLPARGRSARQAGAATAARARGRGRRDAGGCAARRRAARRDRDRRAARTRRAIAHKLKASSGPKPGASSSSPTTWCARASGSSAATAGPTTSATAAWITCSPRGADVNILVLDTEVYSNTGGQASKSTPIGAVAKFAAAGKSIPKKDLGMLAMAYGGVYVAQVAFGARDAQTVRAFPRPTPIRDLR